MGDSTSIWFIREVGEEFHIIDTTQTVVKVYGTTESTGKTKATHMQVTMALMISITVSLARCEISA